MPADAPEPDDTHATAALPAGQTETHAPAPRRGAGRWQSAAAHAVPSLVDGAQHAAAAVGQGTRSVLTTVGRGLGRAAHALEAPPGAELDGLLAGTDLPELQQGDVLASLALRLDREADLWRNLALRALSRAAWAERMAQLAAAVTLVGAAALATIAGVGALWGSVAWGSRAGLLGVGGAQLVAGALVVNMVAQRVRRGQAAVAEASLARADRAELRLQRIAVAMALRGNGPEAERAALTRLEWDVLG